MGKYEEVCVAAHTSIQLAIPPDTTSLLHNDPESSGSETSPPGIFVQRSRKLISLGIFIACTGLALYALPHFRHRASWSVKDMYATGLFTEPRPPFPIYCGGGGHSGPDFGNALVFNGATLPRNGLTLVVDIWSTKNGVFQEILGWGSDDAWRNSVELRLTPKGNLEYGEGGHEWNRVIAHPRVNLADGSWHRIAVVRNGWGLVHLHANGSVLGQGVVPPERPEVNPTAKSARLQGSFNDFVFHGKVRNVRIYGAALNADHLHAIDRDPCPGETHESDQDSIFSDVAGKLSRPKPKSGKTVWELGDSPKTTDKPADSKLHSAMLPGLDAGSAKGLRIEGTFPSDVPLDGQGAVGVFADPTAAKTDIHDRFTSTKTSTSTSTSSSSTTITSTTTLTSVTTITTMSVTTTYQETLASLARGSLFCFELMMPTGYEPGLVKMQLKEKMGIFECDDFTVFSSRPMTLGRVGGTGRKVWTTLVYGSLKVKLGGSFHTALNTPVFIRVWRAVANLGLYKQQSWTVKVDPDAVFLPQRLRTMFNSEALRDKMAGTQVGQAFTADGTLTNGVYLVNCKYGLHGPLEVISRKAVKAYVAGLDHCDDLANKPWGEDWFMDRCLTKLGVRRVEDFNLLREDHCGFDPAPCTANDVAFHPFKKTEDYASCWRNASRSSYGQGYVN